MTEKELQELEVFEKEHHKLDRNTILEFDIDKNVVAKQKKSHRIKYTKPRKYQSHEYIINRNLQTYHNLS